MISSEDAEFIGFSEKRNKLLNEIEKRNSVEYSAIESKRLLFFFSKGKFSSFCKKKKKKRLLLAEIVSSKIH